MSGPLCYIPLCKSNDILLPAVILLVFYFFRIYRSGSSEDVSATSDDVLLTNADETDEEDVGLANESVDDKSAL